MQYELANARYVALFAGEKVCLTVQMLHRSYHNCFHVIFFTSLPQNSQKGNVWNIGEDEFQLISNIFHCYQLINIFYLDFYLALSLHF